MLQVTPVSDGWRVGLSRAAEGTPPGAANWNVPASVPGCVHTDLMAAALLADPYLDQNETAQHWIGNSDWLFETTVDVPMGDRVDVVFGGVQTVAEVRCEGAVLGTTANMHRSYRFDVTAWAGSRVRLSVTCLSTRAHALAEKERLGARPGSYEEPYHYVRTMACSFGWDWGPTLLTCGIWKPVRFEAWAGGRLASVRPTARVSGESGVVAVRVRVDRAGNGLGSAEGCGLGDLVVTARCSGSTATATLPPGVDEGHLELAIPRIDLWWPAGMGGQPLYDLTVELSDGSAVLDRWQRRIGFRHVELETHADAYGATFGFRVNGTPVFARGFNWIPDDCFPARITRERLESRIGQALAANANLLRVWGGGMYESDDFYDICDERGVLVWQDFLFACAAYPEEEPLAGEVQAEARENVERLMPHPSLVLWNGNNENIWGHEDWGWREELAGRTWGWGYYTDLLPRVVAEVDPGRPYWPGSPYSELDSPGVGGADDAPLVPHPNDPAYGPTHIWTVWNRSDYSTYREWRPRFVAEFGYQAPPTWATLTSAIHDQPLTTDSPGMLAHQKARGGNRKLLDGMRAHLPGPRDMATWHYLTQVNQAEAIRYGIEHFRSLQPLCRGAILWQLNDCWPVTSWSAVDGGGRRKPLWYAVRRAFRPRLATIQPGAEEGRPDLVLVNETESAWPAAVTLCRLGFDGRRFAEARVDGQVEPYGVVRLPIPPDLCEPEDRTAEVLVADVDDGGSRTRALWFFAEDKDLRLVEGGLEAEVRQEHGRVAVTVHARHLARHVMLQADRIDPGAGLDEQLVTLLPGESVTFVVETDVVSGDWVAPPVLWSLDDVMQGADDDV